MAVRDTARHKLKHLGLVAMQMEELHREGRSFEEICEILWTEHKIGESRLELEEIRERPKDRVLEREAQERISSALKRALDSLSPEDQLIVRMSILGGLKVVDIARFLDMEQKPLYRRREKLLRKLRSDLEREGVRWEDAGRTPSVSDIPADPDLESAALINAEIDDLYDQIWSKVSGCKDDSNLPAAVAPLRKRLQELQKREAYMMEQRSLAQLRFDPVEGEKFIEESRRLLGKKR